MVAAPSFRTALLLGSALCLPVSALAGGPALPQGGQFSAGAGSISRGGGQVTVNQTSARGIIDWKSFSIGTGKTVAINNGSGATLNVVTGSAPSSINGTLTATGSAYLVNPQGVVVGPSGVISTGGAFAASTRPADRTQFLQNGSLFLAGTGAAGVVNQGQITAGGQVVLVGQSVQNAGAITAGGPAVLAAGNTMVLQAQGDNAIVSVQGGSGDVTNTGRIAAASAALRAAGGNVYALAGSRAGSVQAGSAAQPGRVFLDAAGDVVVTGTVAADGAAGGQVSLSAGRTARVTGTLSARGRNGAGGLITVTGQAVQAGASAVIDASGAVGGGAVRLGGDRQGGASGQGVLGAPLPNATTTGVESGAQIRADGNAGPGGSVVVWSTGKTGFGGLISATGTTGGAAEVSSQGVLGFTGRADLRGTSGAAGTLLLDPNDVVVTDGPVGAGQSAISPALIAAQLGFSNFTILTDGTGSSGAGNGDILVNAALGWTSANTLTLSAARNITIAAPITAGSGGAVTVIADSGLTGIGAVSFSGSGAIKLSGGGAASITTSFSPSGSLPESGLFGAFVHGGTLTTTVNLATPSQFAQLSTLTQRPAGKLLNFDVVADIDLSGVPFSQIDSYNGTFNGLGHTISNLTLNSPSSSGVGFVGYNFGTIENVTFYNSNVVGYSTVGLVAATNHGTIQNVTVTGTDYTTTNITANNAGYTSTDPGLVGGITALNDGVVTNVYFNGTVHGGFTSGGIAGYNGDDTIPGTISRAQTYPDVANGYWSAGIAGQNRAGSTITNSFMQGGVYGTYSAGITAVNYGTVSNVLAVNGASHDESHAGAVIVAGYNFGLADNIWYDVSPFGRVSTYGNYATTAQFYNGGGPLVNSLPPGFDPAVWTVHPGGFATVFTAYTPPAAPSVITLSGTVSGAAAGATLGVNAGGTMYGPVTLAPAGSWTVQVPAAAAGGTDVVASLLTGGAGSTLVSGITSAAATVPLVANTTTLLSLAAADTSVSALEAAKTAVQGGSTLPVFGPSSPAAQGAVNLSVDVPQALAFDTGLTGTGVLQVSASGLTQSAPLTIAAARLTVAGNVALAGQANAIGALAGHTGAISLQDSTGLTIGTVAGSSGLVSGGSVSITGAGAVTLDSPVTAHGGGDALVITAQSFTNAAGAAGLSVSGGGRFVVYLPDAADLTLGGLAASHLFGVPAGGAVGAGGNAIALADQPIVSITPNSLTVTYSGVAPALTYSTTGLVLGDTLAQALSGSIAVLGGQAAAGTTTLSIAPGLTPLLGYVLATGTGTLTVNQKPLTWSVASASATYGTQAVPGAVQLNGLVGTDSPAGLVGITSASGAAVALSATTNAGTYAEAVTGLTGASAGNYQLAAAGNQPGVLTIAPKPLTWAVADAAAVTGTQPVPGAATLSGVAGSDQVAGTVAVLQNGNPVVLSPATPAGLYQEIVAALSGASAANYQLAGSGNSVGNLTVQAPQRPVLTPAILRDAAIPPLSLASFTVGPQAGVAAPDSPAAPLAGDTAAADMAALTLTQAATAASAPAAPSAPVLPQPAPVLPPAGGPAGVDTTPSNKPASSVASAPPSGSPAGPPADGTADAPALAAETPDAAPSRETPPASGSAVAELDADGLASAVAGSSAPALFTATLNRAMAAGASPADAVLAAQRGDAMLAEANVRAGAATPDQALADAAATGGAAGVAASVLAALQTGLPPNQALAQGRAQTDAAAAQLDSAAVAQTPESQAAAALSAGNAAGPDVTPAAAALLARGESPEQSLAEAGAAASARAEMLMAAATPLSPAAADAAALASGDNAAADPLLARYLAAGAMPEDAAIRAAQAQAQEAAQRRAAQVPPSDPQAASLAQGVVPDGQVIVLRGGEAVLQADQRHVQTAAASVAVPDGCIAGPQTPGCGAVAPDAETGRVLALLLAGGLDYQQALQQVARHDRQAEAMLSLAALPARDGTPFNLDLALARGTLAATAVPLLAGSTMPALFQYRFNHTLHAGVAPLQALRQAGGTLPPAIVATPDAPRTQP